MLNFRSADALDGSIHSVKNQIYLLEKLPDDRMSDDELELLAPWNETVKAEIERRANESNQSYVNCQGAPAAEKQSGIFSIISKN